MQWILYNIFKQLHAQIHFVQIALTLIQSSISGLIALYQGEAEITGIHLWDEKENEYNLPFVRHFLINESVCVVNLVQREQGFIVATDNPLKIQDWPDLAKKGVRFINRQKGSATRQRYEAQIKAAQIPAKRITGYDKEEYPYRSSLPNSQRTGRRRNRGKIRRPALRLGLHPPIQRTLRPSIPGTHHQNPCLAPVPQHINLTGLHQRRPSARRLRYDYDRADTLRRLRRL